MNILKLAEILNKKSIDFQIGNLQEIRKNIKNLKKKPGKKIFRKETISNDEGWAFHYGGRNEIQFNIGIEKDLFRYGLAFSLEPTQTLPNPEVLYPKIYKLNCLFRERPELFSDYLFWYWYNDKRSEIIKMSEIPADIVKPRTFIFFGKLVSIKNIDEEKILTEFDKMLPIYRILEADEDFQQVITNKDETEFIFNKDNNNLVFNKKYSIIEKEINVDIRHSEIQIKLKKILESKYGEDNVSLENPFNGNRIDAVAKTKEGYIFYEIKTANTAKSCIRQAVGQLLEYGFWPGKNNASKIVVVGEPSIDKKTKDYIIFLKDEFKIPIDYLCIDKK